MSLPTITVTVPATTANIGAGFDCLGAALSLYNQFEFSPLSPHDSTYPLPTIKVTGLDAERVPTDATNLSYQAFLKLYQQIQQPPPAVHLAIALHIPLSRGLGSSATAIVGGLVGANAMAGSPLSTDQVMALAIEMEGHPDNVVPALIGGCQLAATNGDRTWTICDVPWHEEVIPVVAIPEFELSTTTARQVLPTHYSRADAIFNAAHLGLLLRGLQTGQADWLSSALQDRIHQPYRQHLIKGYDAVQTAALEAGAYGMVISGAGPTLLALAHPHQIDTVAAAMAGAWASYGMNVQTLILRLDTTGTLAKSQ
ncbi:MAG: homoserine kinase [Leptolyngbyaceae cyanobacterium CRU_2_3]|nr:homoserine kinase [Leptolyngbyaceae cyanobacterium CRU_2_3]